MRTTYPVLVVIAIAAAAAMWGMAGVGDVYTSSGVDDLESSSDLEEQANASAAGDGSINGSVGSADSNGGIVGLILAGASSIASFASVVALLPVELHSLGAPWWFALPIGVTAQAIVGVGIIEFTAGRTFR